MNISPKIRSRSVTVRTKPETFKAWVRLAKKEGRSLTNMLETAMQQYESRGKHCEGGIK